jgi:RNA polymerase sigma-70 factor (ECF subfamily)
MGFETRERTVGAAGEGAFVTTRWSQVVLAGDSGHPDAHEALSGLCHDYWRPLYYFARRKGHRPEDAQDLTQGFIAGLLEKGGIARANPERGKFRTFLLSAFSHYLSNQHREQMAQKRGGNWTPLSLNDGADEGFLEQAVDTMTPEEVYDRSWAFSLLEKVMGQLRAEYARADRTRLFEAIQPHLSGAAGRPGYASLGASLGMSESAITVAVHRMRRRYGELLREEIAATVTSPKEVDDELRHLIQMVSTSPAWP